MSAGCGTIALLRTLAVGIGIGNIAYCSAVAGVVP
jgi:hypothetical protein